MREDLSNVLYLWPRRTVFVGRVAQPIKFSQAAASLVLGLQGPISLKVPDRQEPIRAQSLLLAPGTRATIEPLGQTIAVCYLDALGRDQRMLSGCMKPLLTGVHGESPGEFALRQLSSDLYHDPLPPVEAYALLEQGINPHGAVYPSADPRIEKVVAIIQSEISRNLSAEELAQQVNLSVSRLVELFREQVGVPIRRYRQWHRLFVTFTALQQGKTLTDSAIAAGFTDSAHLSHTARVTLGMKPSDILAMLTGRLFVDIGQGDAPAEEPGHRVGLSHPL
jgi:AraC-like DNA-binding protein